MSSLSSFAYAHIIEVVLEPGPCSLSRLTFSAFPSVVRSGEKGYMQRQRLLFKICIESKVLGLVGYAAYIVTSVGQQV
jgi:hypothetical protein